MNNTNWNSAKSNDVSIFEELFLTTVSNHSLTYLCLIQNKKQDDIKYETIMSHLIQYFIDDSDITQKLINQILDIDKKRKLLSILLLELKTLYITTLTLKKLLELDLDIVKHYTDIIKYFDNYGIKFSIDSIETNFVKNKVNIVHKLSVDTKASDINLRTEKEIKEYLTNIGNKMGCTLIVNIVGR